LLEAQRVDGAMLGDGREPGAGIARDTFLRPPFEGRDEALLQHLLGPVDAAEQANEHADEARGFASHDIVEQPCGKCVGHVRQPSPRLPRRWDPEARSSR